MYILILLIIVVILLNLSLSKALISQQVWGNTTLNSRFDSGFNDSSQYNGSDGFSIAFVGSPVINQTSLIGNGSLGLMDTTGATVKYTSPYLRTFKNITCWAFVRPYGVQSANDRIFSHGEVNQIDNSEFAVIRGSGTLRAVFYGDTAVNTPTVNYALANDSFNLVWLRINNTDTSVDISLGLNSTEIAVATGGWTSSPTISAVMALGSSPAGSDPSTMLIDDFNCVNKTLLLSNITKIWNSGNGEANEPANATISISNSSPVATLNFPNSNTTHNNTLPFNFSISDVEKDNITYAIYADTNLNPITKINETNVTQGNFTFIYTFNTQVASSINGTYYWKVNGTDNASNIFASNILTFNITNNLNLYNITNVSMTPLPLSSNTQAKCHFNLTNKAGQKDNITKSDLRWFINRTLLVDGNNNTLLNAPNVSNNANISCQVRVQTYLGETGWTEYVNSTYVSVGDSQPPTITNMSVSKSSYLTTEVVNITAIATDNLAVSIVRVTLNDSTGNRTMNLIGNNLYSLSILFALGDYNITHFIADDGSGNRKTNDSNWSLQFSIINLPSAGGGASGGGGGAPQAIINVTNITITELTCNKNGICNDLQQGEDFINCPSDCKFSVKAITCDDLTIPCIFKNALVARLILLAIPISLVFIILPPEARRRIKKQIFGG